MYREDIRDVATPMWRARKANSSASYVTDSEWIFTRSDNLRTSGVDTPNFHKLKRSGALLPFTPFLQIKNETPSRQYVREIKRLSDGWQSKHWGPGINHAHGDLISFTAGSSVGDGKTNPDAIMQAVAARTSGAMDVLTFAAEFGQVVRMFVALLTKVTRVIASQPPDLPWNVWLELRYGWRTLAFDMNNIEEAFTKSSGAKVSKASAGQSTSWVVNATSQSSLESVATQYTREVYKYSMNSRGKMVMKGDLPRFQINVLKTAWEVTRLSFVVDWFVNIGRWIDSVSFVVGGREYVAGLGDQVTVDYTGWIDIVPDPGYVVLVNETQVAKNAIVQRRGPASIPLHPLFSLNLDRWKIADLLALLVQALWRK